MTRLNIAAILAAFAVAGTFASGAAAAPATPRFPTNAFVALVPTAPPSPPAPSASPSSAATASAAATSKPDRETRLHRGLVICQAAPFFSWPDRNGIPNGTAYPPARMGDSLEVIGDGTLAYNGVTYYETTVDVLAPYGVGKHYYIPAECVNAG